MAEETEGNWEGGWERQDVCLVSVWRKKEKIFPPKISPTANFFFSSSFLFWFFCAGNHVFHRMRDFCDPGEKKEIKFV